jgi:hypothetical protein
MKIEKTGNAAPLFKITKGSTASNMKFWLHLSQPYSTFLLDLPSMGTRLKGKRRRAELPGNDSP